MSDIQQPLWYAMRVFNRKLFHVKSDFDKAGWQTYVAMRTVDKVAYGTLVYIKEPIMPTLLFVRASSAYLTDYKKSHFVDIMLYSDVPGGPPRAIPDAQMDTFIFVTSVDEGRGAEFLGDDRPLFHAGQRVKVTGGIYKGVEGTVRRIKKDRKLLVAVEGVAVIAVSNIPFEFLQPIEG